MERQRQAISVRACTKDGERLVEAIQLIYNDITPNYTLTKDGVTPTQQATEYLGKLFYDLGKAGILKDSVANKLVVSNSLRLSYNALSLVGGIT